MAKSSMKLDLRGVSDLLERIQKVGGNIDAAAEKALLESAKPCVEDLKSGIKKHRRTGLTEPEPFIRPAIQRNQAKARKIQQEILSQILEDLKP